MKPINFNYINRNSSEESFLENPNINRYCYRNYSNSCNCCNCCNSCPHTCCKKCKHDCECDIIKSIAKMEAGLAHILNAEGEKLQKAIMISDNICDLLKVNKSVRETIEDVTELEIVLFKKLRLVVSNKCSKVEDDCDFCID